MGTEIVQADAYPAPPPAPPVSRFEVGQIWEMAQAAAASGLFPGVKTPQVAFTLMLLCDADGLHPIQAVRRFHIIEGKPSMRSDAMLAEFQRRGGWVRWGEMSARRVAGRVGHRHYMPDGIDLEVTIEQFDHLKSKPTWKNHPDDMLVARFVSKAIRRIDPGVIVGIYTPDEIDEAQNPPHRERLEPPARDATPKAPQGLPATADVPVIGWRSRGGPDGRTYLQVAKDAASEGNSQLDSIYRAAGLEPPTSKLTSASVHGAVFRAAVEAEHLPKPEGTIKAGEACQAIAEFLYPERRDWVRAAVDAFVGGAVEEAREALVEPPVAPENQDAEPVEEASSGR